MRWKHKPPEYPEDGEIRARRKFAWRPTLVEGVMVWLEFYAIEERFYQPESGDPGWWWVTRLRLPAKERRILG